MYAILVPVILIIVVIGLVYNSLISKKNAVDNAFGSIDAMLKKRYDLIPNLVDTVKTYMTHEKETLTQITELRTKAMSGDLSDNDKIELNSKLSKMMGSIMVAVENYPNLKANENFLQLQGSLNETEEQISASRRFYNTAVTDYNNGIEMFPGNMLAGMMNLSRKTVFEANEAERQNVKVGEMF